MTVRIAAARHRLMHSMRVGCTSKPQHASNKWDASQYAANASFVPALTDAVIALLNPQPGEKILDLGCGDGVLTEQLAQQYGCHVIGVDASAAMVHAALQRGVDARVMDGQQLSFGFEFDAVFSNAALHWMKSDPRAVVRGVARALKPGGRFVGEFGAHGNVGAITSALAAVLPYHAASIAPSDLIPWYYPTADEYAALLQSEGFVVDHMETQFRPTPLPTGIGGWLDTFATWYFDALPPAARGKAREEVIEALRPALQTSSGQWVVDYVRLRFAASLPA